MILSRDARLSDQRPFDPKRWVIPANGALAPGIVERSLFVEEHDVVGEREKSVSEAGGHIQLFVVEFGKVEALPLPIRR